MLDLSSLFYSTVVEPTLDQNVRPTDRQLATVDEARRLVRECLRERLPKVLADAGHAAVRPRFFTQGSRSYGTLIGPAHRCQQLDLDDGCYLPLSFLAQTSPRPSVAATIFFAAAEEALRPLVTDKRWRLITDKPTCIRIEIAFDAHIDIPLYAIPDSEFHKLEARAAGRKYADLREMILDAEDAERDIWLNLPVDCVLLAHRKEDWKKSDPRPLKKWLEKHVGTHGKQLLRIIIDVKALRDWLWPENGPASILLMAALVPKFEAVHGRDDLALLAALEQLPATLQAGVCNPVEPAESLTDRLGVAGVAEAALRFEACASILREAAQADAAEHACALLVRIFGPRLPDDPPRLVPRKVAKTVLATPATVVAKPLLGRTKAG